MGQRGAGARKRFFDVHGRFSLTGCPRVGYGSPRGWRRPDWVNAYVSVCLLAYYVEWPTMIAR